MCQDKEATNRVRMYPEGAGYDDGPRWRVETAAGETRLAGLSSYPSRSAVRLGFAPKARRPENARDGLKRSLCVSFISCATTGNSARLRANWPSVASIGMNLSRSADLGTEAAETLRSPSGGVPAARGEAAATSERSERERLAVRWAVEAEVCGAVGCGRSDGLLSVATGDGRRVLCPEHARRWAQ